MKNSKLDQIEQRTVDTYDLEIRTRPRQGPAQVADPDIRFAFSLTNPNPILLDIGCGYGRVIPALRKIGPFKYVGIDPSKESLKVAEREYPGLDFRLMSLYSLPAYFPAGHFDLVLAITTLQHVTASKMSVALEAVRKVTRKGGIGFFSFPDDDRIIRVFDGKLCAPNYMGPAITMTGWTPETIIPVLERTGFKPIQMYGQPGLIYTIVVQAV